MTYIKSPQRGSHRSALALLALFIGQPVSAQSTPISPADDDEIIVSALRTPRQSSDLSSIATALDPDELESQGLYDLRDALNLIPGVISTSTGGQTGAAGSLFIRGTTTGYSMLVVDGFRLSDSTTPLGNALGGARAYDLGRIEILRGAQGAIYGGESVGGVLWLETARGTGSPSGSATFEAGSFNSLAERARFQGEVGDVSYFLSGAYEETDNDAPAQDFHQGTAALRVEGKANAEWTIGTTFRATDAYFNNSGNSDDHLDAALATVYAKGVISDRWTARFNAGYHQEFYDSDSSFGNFGIDLRAGGFSTDHEITLAENLRLLAGGFFHETSYENTIGTDESRERYGFHSALEWDIVENLTVTGAVRWEDYDEFGDKATWRLGAAYAIDKTGTTIRGGFGTSFRSPSFLDLFGSSFGPGNPNLDPEDAEGWDIGITQAIGENHQIEAAYFRNTITDRIQTSFGSPPQNIDGDTVTEGVEVGLRGEWCEGAVSYRLAWTHLRKSIADQPRNSASASVDWKPTDKSLVGIGATHLADRSWGGDRLESYTTTRVYGSYQITENVKLHARLENIFDEQYELASFFGDVIPGAGRGLYAGITVDW